MRRLWKRLLRRKVVTCNFGVGIDYYGEHDPPVIAYYCVPHHYITFSPTEAQQHMMDWMDYE